MPTEKEKARDLVDKLINTNQLRPDIREQVEKMQKEKKEETERKTTPGQP